MNYPAQAIQKTSYRYHSLCKVCTAKDLEGNPLRDEIDALIAKGERNVDVIKLLASKGVVVTPRNFCRHLKNHASYAKQGREIQSTKAILLQNEIIEEEADVKSSIQRIVNIGDYLIRTGQMPVTPKLYMDALKEGNKPEFGSNDIHEWLRNLNRKRFEKPKTVEGEVVTSD